jgi:hypothetical protein
MIMPRFINTIVEELGKLAEIHRQQREDGHSKLIDMYYSRAQNALFEYARALTDVKMLHWKAEAESAVHAMRRSADAIGADVSIYQRNIEGLLR